MTSNDLEKHSIRFYSGDIDRVNHYYGESIGINKAVRMIVRKHLNTLDEKYGQSRAASFDDIENISLEETND
jgi:hypothetical protein